MQVGLLAARHGRNHIRESGGHGATGGCGTASTGGRGRCGQLLNEGLDSGAQSSDGHLAPHHGGQPILQDQRRVEVLDLQEPFRSLLQGLLRDQAHDLARYRNHSIAAGFASYIFEYPVDGRLLEVGQVHGNLSHAAHQESCPFDKTQAATRKSHGFGNLLGDVNVRRIQENVISNEELACSDNRCPGGGMHAGLAEIGLAGGVGRDVCADAFELPPANVFQPLPFGGGGSRFIQINRNLIPLPDLRAHVPGHRHAVFDGDAFDGNEWHDVSRAHAGMRALVLGEVNQFRGLPYSANRCFLDGIAFPHQGDDAAIVIGIHFAVEQVDAGNLHGIDNGVNFRRIAAFGKVRNAFDKSAGHTREG